MGLRHATPFITTTDGPTRSQFEDRFLAFCERYGFSRPQINARVAGYEVDALFPQQRLIVELDGGRYHSDRRSFESDRDRDADTLAADHITIRVTWERLTQTPDHEAQRLRRIIANRS